MGWYKIMAKYKIKLVEGADIKQLEDAINGALALLREEGAELLNVDVLPPSFINSRGDSSRLPERSIIASIEYHEKE
jgi:hypothetical protein